MNIYHKLSTAVLCSAALLSGCLFTSCKKEVSAVLSDNIPEDIIVCIDKAALETRTSLNANGVTPKWSSGDKIKVFTSDGKKAVYTYSSGVADSAIFVCSSADADFVIGNFAAAYYPADNATAYNYSTKTITATIPATQTFTANGFANGVAPMVSQYRSMTGKGTNKIYFSNAFALLKIPMFSATGKKITSVKLTSLSSGYMFSGTGSTMQFVTGRTDPNSVSVTCTGAGGDGTLTLDCSASGGQTIAASSSDSTIFCIPVPAPSSSAYVQVDVNTIKDSTTDTEGTIITLNPTDKSQLNYITQNTVLKMSKLEIGALPHYIDENGIDRGEGIMIGDVLWAPVNCGYHETDYPYGKLYQWGRHDGCGYGSSWSASSLSGSAETVIQTTSSSNTPIAASNESSTIFYQITNTPYDWLSTQDNNRWSSATGDNAPDKTTKVVPIKTAKDPCPNGWRVPTYYELTTLLNCTSSFTATSDWSETSPIPGRTFYGNTSKTGNSLFLPAAGYRNCYNGIANSRGSYGYYWSSSVNGTYARGLSFYSGSAYMSSDYRANGRSVRCVQE